MTDNTRSAPSEASEFERWWSRGIKIGMDKGPSRNAWNAAIAAAAAIARDVPLIGSRADVAEVIEAKIRELEAK